MKDGTKSEREKKKKKKKRAQLVCYLTLDHLRKD
jgi:hypothetical protein